MLKIELKPYTSLDTIDPRKIVAFNICTDGHLYLALAIKPLDYRSPANPDQASFAKICPDTAQSYEIHRLVEGQLHHITTIHDEKFNIHQVQPIGATESCSPVPAASVTLTAGPTRMAGSTAKTGLSSKASPWAMVSKTSPSLPTA